MPLLPTAQTPPCVFFQHTVSTDTVSKISKPITPGQEWTDDTLNLGDFFTLNTPGTYHLIALRTIVSVVYAGLRTRILEPSLELGEPAVSNMLTITIEK